MSQKAMAQFLTAAEADEDIAAEFAGAVKNNEGAAVTRAIAELANGKGYAVSAADVEAARDTLIGTFRAPASTGELSEDDLDAVAGGFSIDPVKDGIGGLAILTGAFFGAKGYDIVESAGNGLISAHDAVESFLKKW